MLGGLFCFRELVGGLVGLSGEDVSKGNNTEVRGTISMSFT